MSFQCSVFRTVDGGCLQFYREYADHQLFRYLSWRIVRGLTHMKTDCVAYLLRPFMAQIAYCIMKFSESLLELQILYLHVVLSTLVSRVRSLIPGFFLPEHRTLNTEHFENMSRRNNNDVRLFKFESDFNSIWLYICLPVDPKLWRLLSSQTDDCTLRFLQSAPKYNPPR